MAEPAIPRSERDILDFLDNGALGLHWVASDGTIVWANRADYEPLGYTAAEYIGHNIGEFHADPPVIGDILDRLSAGETLRNYEARLRCKDGSVRTVLITSSVRFDEQGKFLNTRCFTRDITDRKAIEVALQQREEDLRLVTNAVPALISFIDSDLRYRFVNSAYEEWFGRPDSTLAGKRISEVLGEAAFANVEPFAQRALRGETVRFETSFAKRGHGLRLVEGTYIPRFAASGEVVGFAVLISDVTDRKRAEEALRDADRRKDEFLAMLAHELRNPLAPMMNALALLRMPDAPASVGIRAQDVLDRQLRHLTRIVDDLLEVSRVTRGRIELQWQTVDLVEMIREVIADRAAAADAARIVVKADLPAEPIPLRADRTRLAQVLTNVLANSLKFTDAGGTIRFVATKNADSAELSISDDGCGIDPPLLPYVFDAFSQSDRTLHRTRAGLGLGLAVVKGLVDLHGGSVEAHSGGVGLGAEIRFRFPLEKGSLPAPAASASHRTSDAETCRILIVEDNRDTADTLRDFLESEGHVVRVEYDGKPVLEAARAFLPQIVLCDIGLPDKDGYVVAAELRADPGLRTVFLVAITGYGSEADRERARNAGFDLHLTKPVDPLHLADLLRKRPIHAP